MLQHLSHQYANSSGLVRAAQYLRMSSDHQRYSTESQQNAIGEYARQHGYEVVATYIDPGKSGLSLKGRGALKQLLKDALASQRCFDAVLVLDVSRWGRFQNPDQAAHYEFLCREAGVRVVYCAEPFGEDVAPITTIIKHLKRVMAGEYSRELSAKLCRAHLQQAQLGFRQGARLIYGFRRLLVDPARNPRQVLNEGQRKALNTDKVTVIPGPPEELAVIRRVFRLYVREHLTIPEIVSRLAKAGMKGFGDKPIGRSTIRHILSNELCIGRMTYNLTTKRLQGPTLKNPEHLWTRYSAFEPIVPVSQFRKAQELLHLRSRPWDRETIMSSLRGLLVREGRLTQHLINKAPGVPSSEAVVNHFGSLHEAYAAVGYKPTLTPFGANGKHWSKKAILGGLQELYATHGYISTLLIDTSPNLPSQAYIRRNFGSIPGAMREAGLPVLSHSKNQRRSWKRRKAAGCDKYYHGARWTDAKLLRAVQQLYKQYGFISGALLDQNGDTPTAYYFIKRFGSLTKTWILAKLPAQTHSQRKFAAWKRKKEGGIVPRQPRYPGYRHPVQFVRKTCCMG
ncbi:recombinase family protein [Bradyrhizobium australiense]|uniref:Recombinase family protein n=1 Tax=Bradyrhizobium australiense TaxID=2721161 RepID=A0A7Y4GRC6_9BRAD|nr:recombinase family protein [Bradyrhizobium australiense]NOJ40324.1 recombinase family protein [Bradyrhizobium australiense]